MSKANKKLSHTIKTAIQDLFRFAGGPSELARSVNVKRETVSSWLNRFIRIKGPVLDTLANDFPISRDRLSPYRSKDNNTYYKKYPMVKIFSLLLLFADSSGHTQMLEEEVRKQVSTKPSPTLMLELTESDFKKLTLKTNRIIGTAKVSEDLIKDRKHDTRPVILNLEFDVIYGQERLELARQQKKDIPTLFIDLEALRQFRRVLLDHPLGYNLYLIASDDLHLPNKYHKHILAYQELVLIKADEHYRIYFKNQTGEVASVDIAHQHSLHPELNRFRQAFTAHGRLIHYNDPYQGLIGPVNQAVQLTIMPPYPYGWLDIERHLIGLHLLTRLKRQPKPNQDNEQFAKRQVGVPQQEPLGAPLKPTYASQSQALFFSPKPLSEPEDEQNNQGNKPEFSTR